MAHFIYKVLKSFTYAGDGIASAFGERNMKVHGLAMALVLFLSIFFRISVIEWLFILTMIGLVLSAEMMNTAIEEVCNSMRDELGLPYTSSKRARDVAAGAVLVLAVVAALIGFVIFIPKILALLGFILR
jgi:undecaprenol kinase